MYMLDAQQEQKKPPWVGRDSHSLIWGETITLHYRVSTIYAIYGGSSF